MTMNKINPAKLMRSKWTAQNPLNKERHFIVSALIRDEMENIVACEMEAVINHNRYQIDWSLLRDSETWIMGWK